MSDKLKTLIIRAIPVEVHKELKILAIRKNTSLQGLIVDILTAHVFGQREEGPKNE